jgi:hypothetical protein
MYSRKTVYCFFDLDNHEQRSYCSETNPVDVNERLSTIQCHTLAFPVWNVLLHLVVEDKSGLN